MIEYVRKSNGQPKGVIIAWKADGDKECKIGFSLCNEEVDTYRKDRAFELAELRANSFSERGGLRKVPTAFIGDQLEKFIIRCAKFYRDARLPEWCVLWMEEVRGKYIDGTPMVTEEEQDRSYIPVPPSKPYWPEER